MTESLLTHKAFSTVDTRNSQCGFTAAVPSRVHGFVRLGYRYAIRLANSLLSNVDSRASKLAYKHSRQSQKDYPLRCFFFHVQSSAQSD